MFAAIDFAIDNLALRDWLEASNGLSRADILAHFGPWAYPLNAMFLLGNTAKHSKYRDTGWPDLMISAQPLINQQQSEARIAWADATGEHPYDWFALHDGEFPWRILIRTAGNFDQHWGDELFSRLRDRWRELLDGVAQKASADAAPEHEA